MWRRAPRWSLTDARSIRASTDHAFVKRYVRIARECSALERSVGGGTSARFSVKHATKTLVAIVRAYRRAKIDATRATSTETRESYFFRTFTTAHVAVTPSRSAR